MQPAVARSLAGGQWRSLSERTGCSHGACNTAATFDVFFLLQVTNFCVSLLRSAPNGADHFDIDIFVLHTCASPAQRTPGLIITYGSGQDNLFKVSRCRHSRLRCRRQGDRNPRFQKTGCLHCAKVGFARFLTARLCVPIVISSKAEMSQDISIAPATAAIHSSRWPSSLCKEHSLPCGLPISPDTARGRRKMKSAPCG